MLYKVVLLSAVQECDSVISVHISIASFVSLPSTPLGHHRAEHPLLYANFPLASCFTSSVGKESGCNAGDPSSIPESRSSPGEGIGYSL